MKEPFTLAQRDTGAWDLLDTPKTSMQAQKARLKKINSAGGKVGEKTYTRAVVLYFGGRGHRRRFDPDFPAKIAAAKKAAENITAAAAKEAKAATAAAAKAAKAATAAAAKAAKAKTAASK